MKIIKEKEMINDIQYAGFGRRLVAYIFDAIIVYIPLEVISILLFMTTTGLDVHDYIAYNDVDYGESYLLFDLLDTLLTIGIGLSYFCLLHASKYQATLGKMMVGIKVVNAQGKRITLKQSVGRFFATILSGLILYVGYLMVLWDKREQALHDRLAKTYVVRK